MNVIHSDEMFDDSLQKKLHNVETISSSSVLFDKLSDELLIETLIRLPQKPANICKCISVRFRSLISTSYFVRCYLKHHHQINDSFALYYHSYPKNLTCMAFGSPIFESSGFSLTFLPCFKQEDIQYLASNNGLVLCCAGVSPRIVYFVCNPLMKQWIALPPPPTDVEHPYIGFICRNPQYLCNVNDHHEQGKTSSFKVVRIRPAKSKSLSDSLRLEIFCSESGRWSNEYYSTSYHQLLYGCMYGCPSAVVCGGLLYWDNLLDGDIFTYDPYNGKCGTIRYPPGIIQSSFQYCLGESGGRLRYAQNCKDSNTFRVWELKDCSNGGDQWFLLHNVHFDELISTERIDKDFIGLLPPHPLNQDIVFIWCRVSRRILEYNMRTKLLKLPYFLQDARNTCPVIPTFFPFVLPCWPTTIPFIKQHGES